MLVKFRHLEVKCEGTDLEPKEEKFLKNIVIDLPFKHYDARFLHFE